MSNPLKNPGQSYHRLRGYIIAARDDPERSAVFRQVFATVAILLLLVLVAAGVWVVWTVPQWQVNRSLDLKHELTLPKQLELEDAFRKTLAQIVLGVFGLLLLYFTWRRARAGDATVRIMEQGHITDRFTKAIEQLGKLDGDKPNIEVRLGAIYALERIAIDSARDHWTIMEILTAYVRQSAPLDADRPYVEGEKPRTDIQAILTVLGRRKTGPQRERPDQKLDLSNSRLCGAELRAANLQGANVNGANLHGVDLEEANLQGSRFHKANLQRAFLQGANLREAYLHEANLQGASVYEADLQGASLHRANLQRSFLFSASMQRAALRGANLQGAHLNEANLEGASLFGANLQEALNLTLEQVKSARHWESARYSPDFREALGLPPESSEESSEDTATSQEQ